MKLFVSKNCPSCPAAKENMKTLSKEIGFEYDMFDISTDDGQIEALDNMVMSTPTLVLDDEEQIDKDVLTKSSELKKVLKEKLG